MERRGAGGGSGAWKVVAAFMVTWIGSPRGPQCLLQNAGVFAYTLWVAASHSRGNHCHLWFCCRSIAKRPAVAQAAHCGSITPHSIKCLTAVPAGQPLQFCAVSFLYCFSILCCCVGVSVSCCREHAGLPLALHAADVHRGRGLQRQWQVH